MDLKSRYLSNPLDTSTAFLFAESLLQKSDFRSLESFFRSVLPKTLNLNIWSLYIKYISLHNSSSLLPAYSYMMSVMWFHYEIYDHTVEYIKLLDQDVDKIREVYAVALSNPIHSLSSLFQQYEAWELSLSKNTYKTLVNERLAGYQECFKLYQKLLPFISSLEFDNVFKILDLETPERKLIMIRYFKEKFYYKEEVYFLHNELFSDKEALREGIKNTGSAFLRMYFSMFYDDVEMLNLDSELDRVCYLNVMGKRGVEVFHGALKTLGICDMGAAEKDFGGANDVAKPKSSSTENAENTDAQTTKEMESRRPGSIVSPYALIHAARTEYSLTSDPSAAFKIFYLGINGSRVLNEAFMRFLIDINDVCNLKAIFKILTKTPAMWDWMIDFEFKYGSFAEYKRLIGERVKEKRGLTQSLETPKGPVPKNAEGYKLLYELSLRSFGFVDLELGKSEVLEDFMKELPKLNEESVFQNIHSSDLIVILRTVDFLND